MVFDDVETAPERYERYGRNARRAYETRFSPDINVTKLLSIYEFAVENPVWEPEPGSPRRRRAGK